MTTVKATSVRAFELFATDGSSLGLFTVDDTWEGICKLVSVSDSNQTVIVNAPSPMAAVFGNVFGGQQVELDVFKASPDLLTKVMV